MKKILIIVALSVFGGAQVWSQDIKSFKPVREYSINAFDLIAAGALDLQYERYLNDKSSYGGALFVRLSDEMTDHLFSTTAFYRQYFGKEAYKGFFIEMFGAYRVNEDYYNYYYDDFCFDCMYQPEERNQSDFSLGFSVGSKLVSNDRFVAQFYLGVGRHLFNSAMNEPLYARFGIHVGLRNRP
ncbi:MAG: hypothetical protein ACO3A1_07780 [Flavobacteriaceae bacterium]